MTMISARPPTYFSPRACDCDFCSKHGASYLSDPAGTLEIRCESETDVQRYRQGSGNAEWLVCRTCGVMIGTVYNDQGRMLGAVNRNIIVGNHAFGPELPVSPRTLDADEKIRRWRKLWFKDVELRFNATTDQTVTPAEEI